MKLNEKEQWLLFGLIIVVVVYFFNGMVISSSMNKMSKLRDEIKLEQDKLEGLKKKKEVLKKNKTKTPERIRRKKKDEISVISIDYIANVVTKSGLTLKSFKPNYAIATVKQANIMYFDIVLEGTFPQIYKFIRELETSKYVYVIDTFEFEREDFNKVKATLKISSYF